MSKILGLHHVAIRTADFERSLRFYTEVLGLVVKITWGEGDERAAMLDAGDGNYVEIFARGADFDKMEGTILHFAFRTDDCTGMLEKAREAGMEVTFEPKAFPIHANVGQIPIKIAFFKGPDGEIIELFENSVL